MFLRTIFMDEHVRLIPKVAKNYLTRKMLPAVALATGLSGCATDLPVTVPALPNPVRVNKTLDRMITSASEELKTILAEVKRLKFKDVDDVKSKRSYYFSALRALVDDPLDVKYNKLPDSDKEGLKARKAQIDKAIKETESAMSDVFDEAYLRFKPWHRERFELRKP
jgi:hypothetical protein